MAETFAHSGESSGSAAVPTPRLQGIFIPGIDSPAVQDGFGLITPLGGGLSARQYTQYGVSNIISPQETQIHDLAIAPAEGNIFNFEGLIGPQGIPGPPGAPGLIQIITAPNSSFLTVLPHNIDEINQLGSAADTMVYVSSYDATRNFVWTKTDIDSVVKSWNDSGINTDASFFIIAANAGIYVSTDVGDSWDKYNPDEDTYEQTSCEASGGDAVALGTDGKAAGTFLITNDYGVNWTEITIPAGVDLASGTTNGNTLPEPYPPTEPVEREITFDSPVELTNGVTYAIVIRATGADIDDRPIWQVNLSGAYPDGSRYASPDSGSSWTVVPTHDMWFQTKALGITKESYTFAYAGAGVPFWDTSWVAQTFLAESTYTISSVVLRLYRRIGASPGTITVSIRIIDNVIIRSVKLGANGTFIVVAAKDGIYLSTDSGDNWSRKTPDDVEDTDWEKGICSNDGTYIIVVSDADAIYRSANSGSSWAEITPAGGDTFSVNKMATSDDGQFMVIVGQNSTDDTESCYISVDYGATWTAKKPVAASIEYTECDISNDGTVIAVSTSTYFYISFDSGANWKEQGMAASAEVWEGLSISGDGTTGLVANTNNNDEFFIGINTELFSKATWAESTITSAGRSLIDDATVADQNTTLGFGTGDSPTLTGLTLSGLTGTRVVFAGADSLLTDDADFTFITDTLLSPNVTASGTITAGTLTDGTLSITGGSITSGVNATFSGTVTASKIGVGIAPDGFLTRFGLRNPAVQVDGMDYIGFTYSLLTTNASSSATSHIDSFSQRTGEAALVDNDLLYGLLAWGWDGDAYSIAARLSIEVDGDVANNSIPSRFCFLTRAEGNDDNNPIETFSISRTGVVSAVDLITLAGIIIPNNGYIGSVTTTNAIQIAGSGKVDFNGVVDIVDILTVGGDINANDDLIVDDSVVLNNTGGTTRLIQLTASSGVYLGASKEFTTTVPDGIVGHFKRAGTDITTANAADTLTLNGNLTIDLLAANEDAVITMAGATDNDGTITYESDNALFIFDKDINGDGHISSTDIGNLHDNTDRVTMLWGWNSGNAAFEALKFDFLNTRVAISSDTLSTVTWNIELKVGDDVDFIIGNGGEYTQRWETSQTNHYAELSTAVNGTTKSGAIVITRVGLNASMSAPTAFYPNPQLHIHSGVNTGADSRIRIWHDDTDGNFATDEGDLNFIPFANVTIGDGGTTHYTQFSATGSIDQFGSADATLNLTTSSTQTEWDSAYDNMVTALAFNTGDGIITITQQDSGTLLTDSLDGRYYTETELGSTSNGLGASLIGIEDAMSLFTATDVEIALEEIMDKVTPVTYLANAIATTQGTPTGDVTDIQTINDGNEYLVDEATGTPGFITTVTFTGIVVGHEANKIQAHYSYDGNHTVTLQIEKAPFDGSAWDNVTTITNTSGTLTWLSIDIPGIITDYYNSGTTKIRWNHIGAGNINHDFILDYTAIKDDTSGGGGITDHGSMSGLQDDDHNPLYHTDGRAATWLAAYHETTFTHADIATNTTHIGTTHDYAYISSNDGATDITAAELEELTDASETTLHSHVGGFVDRGDPSDFDYRVNRESGTSTGTGGGNTQLQDTAATFQANGIQVGDWVNNITDDTWAQVVTVDSEIQVTVDVAIFPDIGDTYVVGNLKTDGNWHELDLGADIGVGVGAKAVALFVSIGNNLVGRRISFRKAGQSNVFNTAVVRTQVSNVILNGEVVISCDSNQVIEYQTTDSVFTFITIVVKGWWI